MSNNRREFLQQASAGVAALSAASYDRVLGANDRMVVGVIGPGGMGSNHIRTLVTQKDVTISHVCDVDSNRLATAVKNAAVQGQEPEKTADMRRVLDQKDIVGVFIATPDHWHAPATLLALDAGKHVYVEKPCAHNIREGRLMVDASRRTKKICQVGTQTRSSTHAVEAMKILHGGEIGEILSTRVWNSQIRRNIGHLKPTEAPMTVNYQDWVGPAAFLPYQANRLHSVWRWWYNFGAGDMGNDGVHDLDIGRWGLGVDTHPNTVTALGGKYFFDDDQEFPDTQTVICEWAPDKTGRKKQLIFEQRIWTPYKMEGYENGDAFYGSKGMMLFGKESGWTQFAEKNKEVRSGTGRPDLLAHHRNFFDCIRTGNRPNADIEIGHLSATICHLGNIATRLRRVLNFDPKTEQFINDKEADVLLGRQYRDHWGKPATT